MDGRTDGMTDERMHTQTDKGHFYSSPLPMLGDNQNYVQMVLNNVTQVHSVSKCFPL